MQRVITDEDILTFLRKNWSSYPSQVTLIQAAIDVLWPEGTSTNSSERVVRVILQENQDRTMIGMGS